MFRDYHDLLFSLPESDYISILDGLKEIRLKDIRLNDRERSWFNKAFHFLLAYYKDVSLLFKMDYPIWNDSGDFFLSECRVLEGVEKIGKVSALNLFQNGLSDFVSRQSEEVRPMGGEDYVKLLAFNILFEGHFNGKPYGMYLANEYALKRSLEGVIDEKDSGSKGTGKKRL